MGLCHFWGPENVSAGLSISSNLDQAFGELDAFVLSCQVAGARTVNKVLDQAETAMLRKVSELYGVSADDMRKGSDKGRRWLTRKLATPGNPEGAIIVRGAGFPLYLMKPRQTKAGVTALVKGRRHLYPGTFIARMKSGHIGVFARGAYGSKSAHRLRATGRIGRFTLGRGERVSRPNKWGSSEIPINELYTFGPPEAVGNPDVLEAGQDRIDAQAAKVFVQEVRFESR